MHLHAAGYSARAAMFGSTGILQHCNERSIVSAVDRDESGVWTRQKMTVDKAICGRQAQTADRKQVIDKLKPQMLTASV